MATYSLTLGAHLLLWVFPLALAVLALVASGARGSRGEE